MGDLQSFLSCQGAGLILARDRLGALGAVIEQPPDLVGQLPNRLRRSLTWDHGKEMAEHARFTADTGIPVYFCDPRSPWQRASNENANGLLRQYLPRTADLRRFSQTDLDRIAAELNGRPRQTLGSQPPSQLLAEALH